MQRTLALVAVVSLLPLFIPTGEAQGTGNPCIAATWTDLGPVTRVVRPEVDEYRGRIRFSTANGCSPLSFGCPDSGSTKATFELVTQQQPWLIGNFTANPVPVNGSGGGLNARSAETEIFFKLDRTAPFESNFPVQVRLVCERGASAQTSRQFRVGPLVDVNADVIDAATLEGGAQWVIRITNSGNVPVVAEFEPHPSDSEADVHWTVPEFQLVPVAEGDAGSIAVAVTILVEGEQIPGNLSLTLRMREADDEQAPPFEFELPLPYTVFTGKSTPTVGLPWLLILLCVALVARRR